MSINKHDTWKVIDQCNCLQFKDKEGQKRGSSVEYITGSYVHMHSNIQFKLLKKLVVFLSLYTPNNIFMSILK